MAAGVPTNIWARLGTLGMTARTARRGLVLRLQRRGRGADGTLGDRDRHGRVRAHPGRVEWRHRAETTIGRISTFGVLPLSPTLDTPGPITRDVEDAALLLAVLQGEDRRDRRTLGVHDVDPMPDLRRGVK